MARTNKKSIQASQETRRNKKRDHKHKQRVSRKLKRKIKALKILLSQQKANETETSTDYVSPKDNSMARRKLVRSNSSKYMSYHSPNQFAGKRILKAIKRRSLSKLNATRNIYQHSETTDNHAIVIESDDSDCVCLGFQPSSSNTSKLTKPSKSKQKLNHKQRNINELKFKSTSQETYSKFNGSPSLRPMGRFTSTPIHTSKTVVHTNKAKEIFSNNNIPPIEDHQNETLFVENNSQHVNFNPSDFSSNNVNRIPILPESKFSVLQEEFLDDDILMIEDAVEEEKTIPEVSKLEDNLLSSVIVINDSENSLRSDFIPLVSKDVPKPIPEPPKPKIVKQKPNKDDLFTSMEKRQLDKYNDNTYNPSAGVIKHTKKRTIIVDGSNVAFNHGLSQEFSVKGIRICIEYFKSKGHEVKAILPLFRLHKCSDPDEMKKLHQSGYIVFTPCKNVLGKTTTSYDDRFILQLACELDAVIVSNDNYRDLICENTAFEKIIKNRVIGYTWCNDIFLLPKDPYGRNGPTLHSILNRA